MNAEIFGALRLLEKERGISMDFMLEKINKAIITACKNTYDGNEDVVVSIDEENGIFEVEVSQRYPLSQGRRKDLITWV